MPIQLLSSDLINKIAAGEVIERPASVVKELVENAIDAKATQITIEIQDAGKRLIRVSDNGVGMNKDELKLSVERHSTSKISSYDDLFNIHTLGFRGEALPSICSVSKVEITSKAKDEVGETCHGMSIQIEGGKIKKQEETGCPEGTSVAVKELFYNVPARKKFLKSNYVEMGHISTLISKLILSNPSIKFRLISDGKQIYSSSGNGELLDAISSIYKSEIAKELIEIRGQGIGVSGYISKPNLSRVDRNYESIFVNGRYIRNALVSSALESAYRTLIPQGRYPIAVLFISVPGNEVDVNVHPTKREVKFLKTREVLDAVAGSAKKALVNLDISSSGIEYQSSGIAEYQRSWNPQMEQLLIMPEMEITVTDVQPLIPIYQFKNTYIVATDGEDLVLIDQHAAHERILFDQLSNKSEVISNQSLLIPENVEFDHQMSQKIEKNIEIIRGLGIDIDLFGKDTFVIRSIPQILGKANIKDMIQEIGGNIQETKDKINKLLACHGAIKAGDKLSIEEMNQLIRDLYKTDNPLTCPHGRPTIIKFSEADLAKLFKRT